MEAFYVGEVVYLKSGGPPMVVDRTASKSVAVRWFDGTKLKKAVFLNVCVVDADVYEACTRRHESKT